MPRIYYGCPELLRMDKMSKVDYRCTLVSSATSTSLGQNDMYTSFYFTLVRIFVLTGISRAHVLKFYFFLLICCMSFELFKQPEELKE